MKTSEENRCGYIVYKDWSVNLTTFANLAFDNKPVLMGQDILYLYAPISDHSVGSLYC